MVAPADLRSRLDRAAEGFVALRGPVLAGEPWPVAAAFANEAEAAWGPPELLAHVTEMLPYWLGEVERVLAGRDDAVPFGRVATDPVRIAIISRDRTVPLRELYDRVESDVARCGRRLEALTPADLLRRGLHPRDGVVTIGDMLQRFVIGHLEEHTRQLAELLADRN